MFVCFCFLFTSDNKNNQLEKNHPHELSGSSFTMHLQISLEGGLTTEAASKCVRRPEICKLKIVFLMAINLHPLISRRYMEFEVHVSKY